MSDNKILVFSIVKFLKDELRRLTPEAGESIEVAIQCLENAYELGGDPCLDIGVSLTQIFNEYQATLKPPEASEADKVQAEKYKTDGNNSMREEQFENAVDCYSKAIQLDGNNPVYYCNRAAAYSRLNRHHEAINDCKKAIRIDPTYSKAYGRLGVAYTCINDFEEAKKIYQKAVELEPDNQTYLNNLEINEEKLRSQAASNTNRVMNQLPQGAFDFQQFVDNPAIMTMASQLLSDPGMRSMMQNMLGGNGGEAPGNMDALLTAGQRLAQHMQNSNPELVEHLRRQMNNSNGRNEQDRTE